MNDLLQMSRLWIVLGHFGRREQLWWLDDDGVSLVEGGLVGDVRWWISSALFWLRSFG